MNGKVFMLFGIALLALTVSAYAQPVFLNEFSYDCSTTNDADCEWVEIAGPAGTDLSGWTVVLYNGSGGGTYTPVVNLSGTIDNEMMGYGALSFDLLGGNQFQNGNPDGLALVDNTVTLVQFLSYEGSFLATNGVANGNTSQDVGVAQTNADTNASSLYLTGNGTVYTDFTWAYGASGQTKGSLNAGQTFPLPVADWSLYSE